MWRICSFGGVQFGDTVFADSVLAETSFVLNTELIEVDSMADAILNNVKIAYMPTQEYYNRSYFMLKEYNFDFEIIGALSTEIGKKSAYELARNAKIMNYKDYYNLGLNLYGYQCDGICSSLSEEGAMVSQLLSSTSSLSILNKITGQIHIFNSKDGKLNTLSMSIAVYPEKPTEITSNTLYLGENGNTLYLKLQK